MVSVSGSSSFKCMLCLQGYTISEGGCVPCQVGCLICSIDNLLSCIQCAPGYTLNSNKICQTSGNCPQNCLNCSTLGCSTCLQGYYLNQDRLCQLPCETPCSTCIVSDVSSCISCVVGYFLSGSSCLPDLSCSSR